MTLYDRLSPEGKTLLDEALARLKAEYEPKSHLVYMEENGKRMCSIRNSMYYALALLIRGEEAATVEAVCRAVTALQMNAPGEVFHGAFRHSPDEPFPPAGQLNADRLGLYGRYFFDCAWERAVGRFAQRMGQDAALKEKAAEIEALLNRALNETLPVAWDTYEPNTREFILMCLAMMLEHGKDWLSPCLFSEIDRCARLAMEGAIARSESNFTPLNTNIQCMHVFLLDYFGKRLGEPAWREKAVAYAQGMLAQYREYHACAEFNSPTYYGVDLSTLGFFRRYCDQAALVAWAEQLEAGIWRDAAAFYNPAMRNFCGPYSRAYELELSVHTCFYDMLYWALGAEKFPWHPFSTESVCNPLMLLGDVRIPADAVEALLTPKREVTLRRQFRELSERGDPENNNALCTATAWITPELMTGALSGSENPSHQLHPLVIFWRYKHGLGTVKLLRCLPDGRMTHMHTVYFDGAADRNRITMAVDARVNRDVDVFFEIECDDLATAEFTENAWRLPGLTLHVSADAPKPALQKINARTLRVVYPARVDIPESMKMRFELEAQLD